MFAHGLCAASGTPTSRPQRRPLAFHHSSLFPATDRPVATRRCCRCFFLLPACRPTLVCVTVVLGRLAPSRFPARHGAARHHSTRRLRAFPSQGELRVALAIIVDNILVVLLNPAAPACMTVFGLQRVVTGRGGSGMLTLMFCHKHSAQHHSANEDESIFTVEVRGAINVLCRFTRRVGKVDALSVQIKRILHRKFCAEPVR